MISGELSDCVPDEVLIEQRGRINTALEKRGRETILVRAPDRESEQGQNVRSDGTKFFMPDWLLDVPYVQVPWSSSD